MKAYMAYSQSAGPAEGALLVFADLPIGTRFYFADDSLKITYTKTAALWASLGDIGVKVRPGAAVRIEVEE
jgi:hypothetical protein